MYTLISLIALAIVVAGVGYLVATNGRARSRHQPDLVVTITEIAPSEIDEYMRSYLRHPSNRGRFVRETDQE